MYKVIQNLGHEHNIQLMGPPLGHPAEDKKAALRQQAREEWIGERESFRDRAWQLPKRYQLDGCAA